MDLVKKMETFSRRLLYFLVINVIFFGGLWYVTKNNQQVSISTENKIEELNLQVTEVQKTQQELLAGMDQETERKNKLLSVRDFIVSVNPNIDIGLAYDVAELNYNFAEKYNIDVDLAIAIQAVESHFHIDAESPVDALGLWQLMPVNCRLICRMRGWEYTKEKFQKKKWLATQLESGFIYLTLLESEYDTIDDLLVIWNSGHSQLKIWRENPEAVCQETRQFIEQVNSKLEEIG